MFHAERLMCKLRMAGQLGKAVKELQLRAVQKWDGGLHERTTLRRPLAVEAFFPKLP
jgi:hypothetical protein